MQKKPKILAVVGPTSSGKSDLAVEIALDFKGEVVSADSRQVYRGLSIGTGKITEEEMKGVPHYLIDVAEPSHAYSVSDFKKDADKAIQSILAREKLPILCGGTGFYIHTVADGIVFPEVPPNKDLREKLAGKTKEELFTILKELDARRAKNVDIHNPRRLIRAIEIAQDLGCVPELENTPPAYDTLFIGIHTDDDILKNRINTRLKSRIDQGMIEEAKKLHDQGLTYERMEELGLEYRYLALYLKNILSKDEMEKQLASAIWHYARRQKTWFKKDKRIQWFERNDKVRIHNTVRDFIHT